MYRQGELRQQFISNLQELLEDDDLISKMEVLVNDFIDTVESEVSEINLNLVVNRVGDLVNIPDAKSGAEDLLRGIY